MVNTILDISASNVVNTILCISASNVVNTILYISASNVVNTILCISASNVVNIIYSSLEMPREELVARNIGLCSGVRATTSLLMSTVLRPHPGSPSSSISMHTHRNKDFNFLSSP